MKRHAWVIVGLMIGLVMVPALANAKEKKESKASAESQRAAKTEKLAKEKEAAARLNETQWAIEMVPLSGKDSERQMKDTLEFVDGKIHSKNLSSAGYPASNFTLTMGDDGSFVWETMQTKEDEGVAFWRGEWRESGMRGILSKHPLKGDSVDYSFSGKMTAVKPVAEKPKTETAPGAAAEVPPVAQAQPKKSTSSPTPAHNSTTASIGKKP